MCKLRLLICKMWTVNRLWINHVTIDDKEDSVWKGNRNWMEMKIVDGLRYNSVFRSIMIIVKMQCMQLQCYWNFIQLTSCCNQSQTQTQNLRSKKQTSLMIQLNIEILWSVRSWIIQYPLHNIEWTWIGSKTNCLSTPSDSIIYWYWTCAM